MDDTLSGAIRQSYNEPEKYQGCKHCNPNHPEYDEIWAIQSSAKGFYYVTLDIMWNYNTNQNQTIDVRIEKCPGCGRDLNKHLTVQE